MGISGRASLLCAFAALLACLAFAAQARAQSDCCVEHYPNPGCDDFACESMVCGVDPFCCGVYWDDQCVSEAEASCGSLCDNQVGWGPLPDDFGFEWVPDLNNPGPGPFPNAKTRPLTTGEPIVVPWALHLAQDATNVAGIIFRVHYDSNELDFVHTHPGSLNLWANTLVNTTPSSGPTPMSIFPSTTMTFNTVYPFSVYVTPLPSSSPGTSSTFRTHVGWLQSVMTTTGTTMSAFNSGTTLKASTPYTFASFSLWARHTSLTTANTDIDFSVPSLWLIRHATTFETGIFHRWSPISQIFVSASTLQPSDLYLPFSFSMSPEPGVAAGLGIEHLGPTPTPLPSECIWQIDSLIGSCTRCDVVVTDECTSDAFCINTCARPNPQPCGPDCIATFSRAFVCRPPTGEPSCFALPTVPPTPTPPTPATPTPTQPTPTPATPTAMTATPTPVTPTPVTPTPITPTPMTPTPMTPTPMTPTPPTPTPPAFCSDCALDINGDGIVDSNDTIACLGCTEPGTCSPACGEWDLDGDMVVGISDFAFFSSNCPNLPLLCPGGSVDHYKVYSLFPEVGPIPNVSLVDPFGPSLVDLTNLGKIGVPVSKAHAPSAPSGVLLRPDEHLSWYEFFEAEPQRGLEITNQFGTEYWSIKDGHFLLVPAIKDGAGSIRLEQHWKCYDVVLNPPAPGVIVNLEDQFHLEPNVAVGSGRYLCTPVEKNSEGPPSFPNEHLSCYDIFDASLSQPHDLDDQFGNHPNLFVENPEALCLPTSVPEPGAMLSLGSGLMLLGWLERRRRRRSTGG